MADSSTSMAKARILSDLKEILADSPEGISASPSSDENLFIWSACIVGPPDTPWEGGIYQLRINFTEHYPNKPPKLRFLTDMYHPNIYNDGSICIDILADHWSPIYTVTSFLTSIQSLLSDPNPSSPANPDAAKLFVSDRKAYNRYLSIYFLYIYF